MQAQTEGRREADLALLLRTLRARGPQSRARLAAGSGLSRATATPLPADLAQRGLTESAGTTTTQGRRGLLVQPRPVTDNHAGEPGHMVLDPLGGCSAAPRDWLVAPQRHGRTRVAASTLGFTAGGDGAARTASRRVLDDPTVVPVKDNAPKPGGSHEGASA